MKINPILNRQESMPLFFWRCRNFSISAKVGSMSTGSEKDGFLKEMFLACWRHLLHTEEQFGNVHWDRDKCDLSWEGGARMSLFKTNS